MEFLVVGEGLLKFAIRVESSFAVSAGSTDRV
jgi:hypothetical protein